MSQVSLLRKLKISQPTLSLWIPVYVQSARMLANTVHPQQAGYGLKSDR